MSQVIGESNISLSLEDSLLRRRNISGCSMNGDSKSATTFFAATVMLSYLGLLPKREV